MTKAKKGNKRGGAKDKGKTRRRGAGNGGGKRRAYNSSKARLTRDENARRLREGLPKKPSYTRKKPNRSYRYSGMTRGKNVRRGSSTRRFKRADLQFLNDVRNKYVRDDGRTPLRFVSGG